MPKLGDLVRIKRSNLIAKVTGGPYEDKRSTYLPVRLPNTPFDVPIELSLLDRVDAQALD